MPEFLTLPPFVGVLLIFAAVVAGHLYRQNWKIEGPQWKAWLYGIVAGGCLLVLAFVPLAA